MPPAALVGAVLPFKVVIRSASVFKGELRILLLNSGDLPSGLAHFLNSDLQGSPKFTRALFESELAIFEQSLYVAV